jgi:hypothetical protein
MTARLEFAKRQLKTPWSDETKIEHFDLNAKRHVCRKPVFIPMLKNGVGSIMLRDVFQREGLGD